MDVAMPMLPSSSSGQQQCAASAHGVQGDEELLAFNLNLNPGVVGTFRTKAIASLLGIGRCSAAETNEANDETPAFFLAINLRVQLTTAIRFYDFLGMLMLLCTSGLHAVSEASQP